MPGIADKLRSLRRLDYIAGYDDRRWRLAVLGDGIDERDASLLHFRDGALERRTDILRVIDRSLAIATHRLCKLAEIRLRPEQVHADMGLGLVGAAQLGHAD